MEEQKISYISQKNQAYPEKLRHIYKPPKGLYVRGSLPDTSCLAIAVVGARECSYYGRETAFYFARELAKSGILIISGLARGIDAQAHKGALEGGGKTYGVLGCGIDVCYPKENKTLYTKVEENGGILSEYGAGEPPLAGYFPLRNRIISGLSEGILVIEARERSGSLITVEHGLEQGKDIFVLPGRINDELSRGCNRLLKAGAIPVTEPSDILQYYGLTADEGSHQFKKNNNLLEKEEKMVYSKVCLVPKHINQVAEECGLPVLEVMQNLISLELKGYIKQPFKGYYITRLE